MTVTRRQVLAGTAALLLAARFERRKPPVGVYSDTYSNTY